MKKFESIQALRALAATLVVATHSGYAYEAWLKTVGDKVDVLPWYNTHIFGAAGVHLFFVISGFIIASQRIEYRAASAILFARNRIARIVPMYWLCTFAFLILKLATSHHSGNVDLVDLVRSLFFVSSGQPILPVGWTLNYEMFFYLVFAIFVVLMAGSAYWIVLFFLLTVSIHQFKPEWTSIYGNPIVLEFAMGVLIMKVYRLPRLRPFGLSLLMCGLIVLFSSAIWFKPDGAATWSTFVAWGLPSAAIVLGAVIWENGRDGVLNWKLLVLIGNASYSLYLIHMLFLFGRWNLAPIIFLHSPVWLLEANVATAIFVAIVTAISVVVHLVIELPLTNLFRPKKRVPVAR